MRHGDVTLFETLAIASYIDETFDGPALQPTAPVLKAEMLSWVSAIIDRLYDSMVRRYILQVIFPKGPDGTPDRSVIDPALIEIEAQMAVVNGALDGKRFLVGDHPTLADLFIAPIFSYLGKMPDADRLFGACPNIIAAAPNMRERVCYTETEPPTE